jgi:hypothetical protein
MSFALPFEIPADLGELASRLSEVLENWDGNNSNRLDAFVRYELRSAIARRAAATIHRVRHGAWDPVQFRAALRSWRLIDQIDEKEPANTNNYIDLTHITGEALSHDRIFIKNISIESFDFDDDSVIIINYDNELLKDVFSNLQPRNFSFFSSMGSSTLNTINYSPIFFGSYLSARAEWRVISAVLDALVIVEPSLDDIELLKQLSILLKKEFEANSKFKMLLKTPLFERFFSLNTYELVRRHFLTTSLWPPLPAVDLNCLKTDGSLRGSNDNTKRRAHRHTAAGRNGEGNLRRGHPQNTRLPARSRQRCYTGRRLVCGQEDRPRLYGGLVSLLLGRRLPVLDFVRVARS